MKPYFHLLIPILVSALSLQAQESRKKPKLETIEIQSPNLVKLTFKKKREKQKGKVRTVPVIYYTILSKSSGNCLAISMGEKGDGGRAIEWTSKLGHEQQWQLKPVEGHWFQLIARHSDKALTTSDTSEGHLIQRNTADNAGNSCNKKDEGCF